MKRCCFIILSLFNFYIAGMFMQAQSAFDFISRNRNFSASNYCIYPDTIEHIMTDAPAGKKPFYISHYGRHGSRYLSNRKGYDIPYRILTKADSLGKLTPFGQDMLHELRIIIEDSEGRWGDLTGLGKKQHRHIAQRMVEHFPEVFAGDATIDARSTTVNRCMPLYGCRRATAGGPQSQAACHDECLAERHVVYEPSGQVAA